MKKEKTGNFRYKKQKAREKKPYLKRPVLERKNVVKIKKLEEGRHRATMAQREREKVREKGKSKGVLKIWALKTEKWRETQKSLE